MVTLTNTWRDIVLWDKGYDCNADVLTIKWCENGAVGEEPARPLDRIPGGCMHNPRTLAPFNF